MATFTSVPTRGLAARFLWKFYEGGEEGRKEGREDGC